MSRSPALLLLTTLIACSSAPDAAPIHPHLAAQADSKQSEESTDSEQEALFGIAAAYHGAWFDADGEQLEVSEEVVAEAQEMLMALALDVDPEAEEVLMALLELDDGEARRVGVDLVLHSVLVRSEASLELDPAYVDLQRAVHLVVAQRGRAWWEERWYLADLLFEYPPLDQTWWLPEWIFASTYVEDCEEAGVPIPPDWPSEDWVLQGTSSTTRADVYTYDTWSGVCVALPRDGENVGLLGIICQSAHNGNACFWDNIDRETGRTITGRIDELELVIEDIQGGDVLSQNCTSCHRGSNVFLVNPFDAALQAIPDRWASSWYTPISGQAGWVNPVRSTAVSSACTSCHTGQGGPPTASDPWGRPGGLGATDSWRYCNVVSDSNRGFMASTTCGE